MVVISKAMQNVQNGKGKQPVASLHIRCAESLEDLDYLRPASVELHNESRFRDIPYSHKKRDNLFSQAIANPERYALVIAEFNRDPVGFIFCSAGEYIVGTDELLTTVFSFYVRKRYRQTMIGGKAAVRLLSTVIQWSKQRNVREILIHVTSGIDIERTDKFLRRANFKVTGANYSFSLNRNNQSQT
ncbi:MAG: GNAT family N-acetyltransferase [Hyphomicrobiales bacterium]|nr:GNAT family N-acetyltransferase [Hyphomicrobiales bacterium]